MSVGRGRPTKLTQVIRVRDDGSEVTAAQQLIERVQLGLDYLRACDSAGVSRMTLHRWRVEGARLRADQAQGILKKPTRAEVELIDFCDALERAEAEAEASRLAIIQRAGMGGARTVKETVKTGPKGEVLERTVTTETMAPQWPAAAWFLKHRHPDRYSTRVEMTGADGAPLVPPEDASRVLADSLRAYLEGHDDGQNAESTNGAGK